MPEREIPYAELAAAHDKFSDEHTKDQSISDEEASRGLFQAGEEIAGLGVVMTKNGTLNTENKRANEALACGWIRFGSKDGKRVTVFTPEGAKQLKTLLADEHFVDDLKNEKAGLPRWEDRIHLEEVKVDYGQKLDALFETEYAELLKQNDLDVEIVDDESRRKCVVTLRKRIRGRQRGKTGDQNVEFKFVVPYRSKEVYDEAVAHLQEELNSKFSGRKTKVA